MLSEIWIWQTEYSPHISFLASELERLDLKVRVLVERPVSDERKQLGWPEPVNDTEAFTLITNERRALELLARSDEYTVHLLQGIRGNGCISSVMKAIFRTDRRCLILMEMVDDRGLKGLLKRAYYSASFLRFGKKIDALLAIGKRADKWVIARGLAEQKVYEFAYFLPESRLDRSSMTQANHKFRLVYAGQLIQRKRVDLLIEALGQMINDQVALSIVGDGPLKEDLKELAANRLECEVNWLGAVPIDQAQREIAQADCLVLPSDFDGWGAVASEALSVGTRVICSDRCGAATLVEASSYGYVFKAGDASDLARVLERILDQGPSGVEQRESVKTWSKHISATSGAHYLHNIMKHVYCDERRPVAPWGAC